MGQNLLETYTVVQVLVHKDKVLGYTLHNRYSLLYVTPQLLELAYKRGIICEQSYQNLKTIDMLDLGSLEDTKQEILLKTTLVELGLDDLEQNLKNQKGLNFVCDYNNNGRKVRVRINFESGMVTLTTRHTKFFECENPYKLDTAARVIYYLCIYANIVHLNNFNIAKDIASTEMNNFRSPQYVQVLKM